MRILCISDQVDPLVYSPRMRERFRDVDLVLSAGDLPMEYLGFVSSMLNCSLVFVSGNHDLEPAPPQPSLGRWTEEVRRSDFRREGAVNAGFRLVREGGLMILGLPGSMLYNYGPNQYREFGMALRIALMVPRLIFNKIFRGRAVDLVLTHSAPRGIHDRDDPCHRGFRSFLWLMRTFKPRWLVHGHIHLYDLADVRISQYADTMVVNAFGHWVLDTESDS
ncbi:MAG TPA: metallophosphoesterase [Rectinemataceae bacterium]|nr:metallophosphoesterase [Rectinemataceae bacterium]